MMVVKRRYLEGGRGRGGGAGTGELHGDSRLDALRARKFVSVFLFRCWCHS